jgi:hypothetical protein
MNEFEKAVENYLRDYGGDARKVLPWEALTGYGFSGVWLRDLEEKHLYRTAAGMLVDKEGVGTFELLKEVALEIGIGAEELKTAALGILKKEGKLEAAAQVLGYKFDLGPVEVDTEEEFKEEELLVSLSALSRILKGHGLKDPSHHYGVLLTGAIRNRLELS